MDNTLIQYPAGVSSGVLTAESLRAFSGQNVYEASYLSKVVSSDTFSGLLANGKIPINNLVFFPVHRKNTSALFELYRRGLNPPCYEQAVAFALLGKNTDMERVRFPHEPIYPDFVKNLSWSGLVTQVITKGDVSHIQFVTSESECEPGEWIAGVRK